MAGYGVVRTFANHSEKKAAELLQRTLNEEGDADKKLTALAEQVINVQAGNAEEPAAKKRGGSEEVEQAPVTPSRFTNRQRHRSPRDCGGVFVFCSGGL